MPAKGVRVETIIQIMPAPGWYAKYSQDGGKFEYCQLVCFALVERKREDFTNSEREVVGMDADSEGVTTCDAAQNFVGYVHESQPGFPQLGPLVDL